MGAQLHILVADKKCTDEVKKKLEGARKSAHFRQVNLTE